MCRAVVDAQGDDGGCQGSKAGMLEMLDISAKRYRVAEALQYA